MLIDNVIKILELFHNFENGELVKAMEDTSHHGRGGLDGSYMSINHMEGSVWAHTMMCLNYFLTSDKKVYYNKDVETAIIIAIICHDIGKIYTRNITESEKVTFHNHPAKSISKTIDFLYFIRDKGIIKDFEYVVNLVLPAVSNHINLYNSSKNKHLYFNNDLDLYEVCTQLGISDSMGSFCSERKFRSINYKEDKIPKFERNCYVFCGLPASGKDYLAEKMNIPILSFDNEKLEFYKKSNLYDSEKSDVETYVRSFNYCNFKKVNLLKLLVRRAKTFDSDIAICNTNLHSSSRRSIINSIGKANFHCIYVVSSLSEIIKRNFNRSNKNISEAAILEMAMNQTIPSIREGFSSVKITLN